MAEPPSFESFIEKHMEKVKLPESKDSKDADESKDTDRKQEPTIIKANVDPKIYIAYYQYCSKHMDFELKRADYALNQLKIKSGQQEMTLSLLKMFSMIFATLLTTILLLGGGTWFVNILIKYLTELGG